MLSGGSPEAQRQVQKSSSSNSTCWLLAACERASSSVDGWFAVPSKVFTLNSSSEIESSRGSLSSVRTLCLGEGFIELADAFLTEGMPRGEGGCSSRSAFCG